MKTATLKALAGIVLICVLSACAETGSRTNTPTQPNKATIGSSNKYKPTMNASGPDEQVVQSLVNARQGQLTKIYQQESSIIKQNGSLKVTLYILENGSVVQADIAVVSGDLKPGLLNKIREQVMTWNFSVQNKVIYTFTVRFDKD